MQRRKELIVVAFFLAFPLFFSSAFACDAEILSLWYTPEKVQAGGNVEIHANVRFVQEWTERCSYLIEGSIIPQDLPYALLPLLGTITPGPKCCPGTVSYTHLTLPTKA